MKVAIFGATGGTGIELIKQALERGHMITVLVRNPARLADKSDDLTVMTGDIHDLESVEQCIQGQDAVICALGARDLKKTMIRTEGTVNIISAMKKNNVKRLVVVSADGVGES